MKNSNRISSTTSGQVWDNSMTEHHFAWDVLFSSFPFYLLKEFPDFPCGDDLGLDNSLSDLFSQMSPEPFEFGNLILKLFFMVIQLLNF